MSPFIYNYPLLWQNTDVYNAIKINKYDLIYDKSKVINNPFKP